MKKYDKILFVSHSDTICGPMAEAILQQQLLLEDILVDSKGMTVPLPEPVNPKAEAILSLNGLSMEEHQSFPFSKDDFDDRTLILAMETAERNRIQEKYPESVRNLYLLTEYCGMEGDISEPLGKEVPEFGKVFEQLRDIMVKVEKRLFEEEQECLQ